MLFAELETRYGAEVASRIQKELHAYEFRAIPLTHLQIFLRSQMEIAMNEYTKRLDNPFINKELGDAREEYMQLLHTRYQEAQDLYEYVKSAESSAKQQSLPNE